MTSVAAQGLAHKKTLHFWKKKENCNLLKISNIPLIVYYRLHCILCILETKLSIRKENWSCSFFSIYPYLNAIIINVTYFRNVFVQCCLWIIFWRITSLNLTAHILTNYFQNPHINVRIHLCHINTVNNFVVINTCCRKCSRQWVKALMWIR